MHQDGLVHISALSHEFVSDPRDVVKAGQIVKVKVMEVDVQRKRIGLSMRMDDQPGEQEKRSSNTGKPATKSRQHQQQRKQQSQPQNAFAAAFANAKQNKR